MSIKVTPDHYPEIIEVYNAEGKRAAYNLIRSQYGIKNPTCVMKRLKQYSDLSYNPKTDRFELHSSREEEGIFLDLEELCNKDTTINQAKTNVSGTDRISAMEHMVQELINDRLLEISKYVVLDPVGRCIIVDKTAMQAAGYNVSIS